MENKEQQLIEEICSLFRELIEEEKGRIDLTARRIVPPNGCEYAKKAKDLYDKAIELESINSKYSTWNLQDIMDEEVREVEQYRYEYESQSNTPKAKSINKLQGLMHDATLHIKMNFHDVLEDIDYK